MGGGEHNWRSNAGHSPAPAWLSHILTISDLQKLSCTATATPIVRDEILERLGLPAATKQIIRGFARPNLALRVREVAGKKDRNGLQQK